MPEVKTVSLNCPACRKVTYYNDDALTAHCMRCGHIVYNKRKAPESTNAGTPTLSTNTKPSQSVGEQGELGNSVSEHALPRWLLALSTFLLARNFFADDTHIGILVTAAMAWLFSAFIITIGTIEGKWRMSWVSVLAFSFSFLILIIGGISSLGKGGDFEDCVEVGRYGEVECY